MKARIGSANSLPRLGDFSTDRRVLILVAMAVLVGAGGAAAAWMLLRVIALATFRCGLKAAAAIWRTGWDPAHPQDAFPRAAAARTRR